MLNVKYLLRAYITLSCLLYALPPNFTHGSTYKTNVFAKQETSPKLGKLWFVNVLWHSHRRPPSKDHRCPPRKGSPTSAAHR